MKLANLLAAGALIGAPSSALASNITSVNITSVTSTTYSSWVYFTHVGGRTQIPSCGSLNYNRFAFNVSTPHGQAVLSTLLTAFAAHKPVTIIGMGSCDTSSSDTEGVASVTISD